MFLLMIADAPAVHPGRRRPGGRRLYRYREGRRRFTPCEVSLCGQRDFSDLSAQPDGGVVEYRATQRRSRIVAGQCIDADAAFEILARPDTFRHQHTRLLPGSEAPTIIPLEGFPDRVAVHAVCRENVFWETLESLKKAGASALLVLPVEKMLV